ncbi:MAG: signal peptidase I [Chloroflexi bacterium]|nr:signal peptidase I [Chloroflexota bacterium]
MKLILGLALALLSLPLWLPTALGGEMSYHFVLSGSMKETIQPGSLIILRRSETYTIGDVVGYRQELAGEGDAIIIHRIMTQQPSGRYFIKGDANPEGEDVDPHVITGRMITAVPYLGYVVEAMQTIPFVVKELAL